MEEKLVKLAEKYCLHYHDGQFRKSANIPFSEHPKEVVKILEKYGYNTPETECIALLHDVIEDTEVITKEIRDRFGNAIATGVYILSRNTIDDQRKELIKLAIGKNELDDNGIYRLRLSLTRKTIQRIKIADMIHNTLDLGSLREKSQEKKIVEAEKFYIPLGKKIAPLMIKELETNIANFKKKASL